MHPIIILWAHPRSMSTAIERIMRERGDFDCLHEPFLHYYYIERCAKPLPHFSAAADHPTGFSETRDMLLQKARRGPVFAKDMSYYIMPELVEDRDFCHRLRHCFLIRNPLRSILSYHKLDAAVSLDEIGIEAQWRQFDALRDMGIDDCVVIEAEAVQADSQSMMRCFWEALGLSHNPKALNWDEDSTPDDWQYVEGWHQNVSASQGIRSARKDEAERAAAEFETACIEAPQLRAFLDHHLPYYQRLREFSLSRGSDGSS